MKIKTINIMPAKHVQKRSFSTLSLSVIPVIFISLSLCTQQVFADELSLGISPPLTKIETKTPADIRTPIMIENRGDENINLSLELKAFRPADKEDGQISFLTQNEASRSAYPAFFKQVQIVDENFAINSVELGPKQKKKLYLRIFLPKESIAKDYYFSILFITKDNKELEEEQTKEHNIAFIQEGIATNVLLSVNPEKRMNTSIEEFSAPLYAQQGPIPFTVRIKNENAQMVSPKGVILITNMFGQTVGRVDLPTTHVLADSIRAFTDKNPTETKSLSTDRTEAKAIWSEKFLLGYYRATLSLAVSDAGPIYTRTIDFVVIPMKILVSTLFSLLIILIIITRIRHKLKAE